MHNFNLYDTSSLKKALENGPENGQNGRMFQYWDFHGSYLQCNVTALFGETHGIISQKVNIVDKSYKINGKSMMPVFSGEK